MFFFPKLKSDPVTFLFKYLLRIPMDERVKFILPPWALWNHNFSPSPYMVSFLCSSASCLPYTCTNGHFPQLTWLTWKVLLLYSFGQLWFPSKGPLIITSWKISLTHLLISVAASVLPYAMNRLPLSHPVSTLHTYFAVLEPLIYCVSSTLLEISWGQKPTYD